MKATVDSIHDRDEASATDSDARVARAGLDGVALKPAECDVTRAADLDVARLVVDYEGREHLPDSETLARLAREHEVRATTPVRVDGFDPLGDDSLVETLPDSVGRVLVAGHGAYLSEAEASRAIASRLGAAREEATEAWVGTEGVERLALAAGGTQFELLTRSTDRAVRALRAAGFDGEVAVYAPTVLSDDDDEILDAVGGYVSRRGAVRSALPGDTAAELTTGSEATGRTREVLLAASQDFALTGTVEEVRERTDELREAGVDYVVGYPAQGLDAFLD
jgi:hypothetical protein